jgi:hypothetical protein
MDGDDIFDEALELQWKSMLIRGYTEEQVNQARQRKKDKDDVRILSYIVREHAWETDISCDRVDVHLKLARSLDAVCRRSDAIEILLEATEEDHPFDSRMCIALAKILFRDDQKDLSLLYCQKIIDAYNLKAVDLGNQLGAHISEGDTLKAYYLAGWIKIHDDNHTKAYETWSLGHRAVRSCPVLKKQFRKRECWDQDPALMADWRQQVRNTEQSTEYNTEQNTEYNTE